MLQKQNKSENKLWIKIFGINTLRIWNVESFSVCVQSLLCYEREEYEESRENTL